MGGILTALAGTFIASAIVLAISFQITGFRLTDDEAFKVIGWLSLGSTALYWLIELYLGYQLRFTVDPSNPLSPQEQYQVAVWGVNVVASILFIIIATLALWLLTIVLAAIDRPTSFKDFIVTLFRFLIVAIILGLSLRFVSGFTTKWVEDLFRPKSTALVAPSQSVYSTTNYSLGCSALQSTAPSLLNLTKV